jgi:ApaG protein
MYRTLTDGIRITVEPYFLDSESNPAKSRYMWAYTVEVANLAHQPVQLISRYWRIIDGNGQLEEVRGDGVVGEQPVIEPNTAFTYTSGCPLKTPDGTMSGSYIMIWEEGKAFEAHIPAFALESPFTRRVKH